MASKTKIYVVVEELIPLEEDGADNCLYRQGVRRQEIAHPKLLRIDKPSSY